jgi:hypothetical protein
LDIFHDHHYQNFTNVKSFEDEYEHAIKKNFKTLFREKEKYDKFEELYMPTITEGNVDSKEYHF